MEKEVPRLEEREQVDVIEDFVYDSENRQYNRDFLHWRRHTKESFIYRFAGNAKESVYTAGGTGTRQSAAAAEEKSLVRCSELIGTALLVFLMIDLIGSPLMAMLLNLFHVDVRMDLLTMSMSGSQWAMFGVRSLITVLKYAVPAAILVRMCRIPQSVYMPASPGALPEYIAAVAAGMIAAGLYALTAQAEGVEMAQRLFTYKDMVAAAIYGLFETVVGSVLAEVLLRGTILTLLRQFGDPLAILMTAAIAFLFPNNPADRICEALIGLAGGYLMIRSGSLFKCVIMRIVYTGLSYARLVVIYANHNMRLWEYAMLLISIGALAFMFFLNIRRDKLRIYNEKTALSSPKKCLVFAQSVSMLPWAALSLLVTLIQLF